MSVQAQSWAYQQALAGMTKFVLVTLANYADAHGYCWPSQEQLAADCGCGERTVRGALAELEDRGLIERIGRRRRDGTRRSDVILLAGFPGRARLETDAPHPLIETTVPRRPGPAAARRACGPPVQNPPDQPANSAGCHTTSGRRVASDTYDQPAESAGKDPLEDNLYAGARVGSAPPVDICARLIAACGPGLCAVGRFTIRRTASVIGRWLAAGWDLEADILPILAARTAKVRGSPIRTWAYFTEAIREARERRLRPAQSRGRSRAAWLAALARQRAAPPAAVRVVPPPVAPATPRVALGQPPVQADPREMAEPHAARIRADPWTPAGAISNTIRDAMLALGRVRAEQLRALGIP